MVRNMMMQTLDPSNRNFQGLSFLHFLQSGEWCGWIINFIYKKYHDKKNVFWISGAVTIGLFAIDYLQKLPFCRWEEWGGGGCIQAIYFIGTMFSPIVPVLLFSIITYKMREEVFRAWWGFACWWTPLSMILIAISPQYADGFMMSPSPNGLAVVGTSILLVVISTIIILSRWFKTRNTTKISQ